MEAGPLIGIGFIGVILMLVFPIYYAITKEKLDGFNFVLFNSFNMIGFVFILLALGFYFSNNYSDNEKLLKNLTIIASLGGIAFAMATTLFSWNRIVWAAD